MGKKTLYIKEDDESLWKKADFLVKTNGGSLSNFITELLRKELSKREMLRCVTENIGPIVIEFENQYGRQKKSFNGKWLIKDYQPGIDPFGDAYSVAVTAMGQLFVLRETNNHGSDYRVFPTYDDMMDDGTVPLELQYAVSDAIGENDAEFLDI